ncbi:MAG: hypothetical protein NTV86_15710 [Planctomycetota bacterium]|nr:hypothetical protein [Planctomycetota bacterium]
MPAKIHSRGSVLLMAVGLLTIIALLGGAFLIVAGMNRKVAAIFRSQGRMDAVAKGKLLELAGVLVQDARLNTMLATDDARKAIEVLGDTGNAPTVDPWLVSYEWQNMVVPPPVAPYIGKMSPSGVMDIGGNEFKVGYRILDAGSMININTAWKLAPAAAGTVMPNSNISLGRILTAGEADQVHSSGVSSPYLMDEFLAFLGGKSPALTATGRLKQLASSSFANVGGLTVRSTSRYSMMPAQTTLAQDVRADLNTATAAELYNAFYNMLAGVTGDAKRDAAAVAMALRVCDFRGDAGAPSKSTGSVPANAGKYFFGLVRQPFITKAAYHKENDASRTVYAIELFNPYSTAITMNNCRLSTGGATFNLTIAPRGRAVLSGGQGAGLLKSDVPPQVVGVNLALSTAILWGDGGNFPIGRVDPTDFVSTDIAATPPTGVTNCETLRRDDRLAKAAYSLAKYASDASAVTGDPALDAAGIGKSNVLPVDVGVKPHPVYVRNGKFINIGDLMRIYYAEVSIGTDGSNPMPLDKSLVAATMNPGLLDNGRLPMFSLTNPAVPGFLDNSATTSTVGNPAVPQGCKATEYFFLKPIEPVTPADAKTYDKDNKLVYGRINLNTSPTRIVACLPGVAGTADPEATATAMLIGTGNPAPPLGKPFLTAGQIARSIGQTSATAAIAYGPGDTKAYAVAADGTDDGLSIAGGEAVFGDLAKQLNAYAWMSNHITVHSDVFVIYLQVQQGLPTGSTATPTTQKYICVIDRSLAKTTADKANIVMFSPVF